MFLKIKKPGDFDKKTDDEKKKIEADVKVSKDAEVTVLLWVGQTVKANHAFAPGKLDKDGIQAVLDDTAKILP